MERRKNQKFRDISQILDRMYEAKAVSEKTAVSSKFVSDLAKKLGYINYTSQGSTFVSRGLFKRVSDSRGTWYYLTDEGIARSHYGVQSISRSEATPKPETPAVEEVPVFTPAEPTAPDTQGYAAAFAEAVANDVFSRVTAEYDAIIQSLLDRVTALEQTPAPAPAPMLLPATPKQDKIRVFLGGAKPEQAFMLKSEFRECLDIRSATSDDINKWKSMAAACDHVVVFKFVSHKHTEVLEAMGKKVQIVTGMTDARDALTKIFAGD